jgi:hypothetical protein
MSKQINKKSKLKKKIERIVTHKHFRINHLKILISRNVFFCCLWPDFCSSLMHTSRKPLYRLYRKIHSVAGINVPSSVRDKTAYKIPPTYWVDSNWFQACLKNCSYIKKNQPEHIQHVVCAWICVQLKRAHFSSFFLARYQIFAFAFECTQLDWLKLIRRYAHDGDDYSLIVCASGMYCFNNQKKSVSLFVKITKIFFSFYFFTTVSAISIVNDTEH